MGNFLIKQKKNNLIQIKPYNNDEYNNEYNKLLEIINKNKSDNRNKWRPNDNLYNRYNLYEIESLCIKKSKDKIKILEEKIKILEDKINNVKINNNYDKITDMNNKTDLINYESEIILLKSKIDKFNETFNLNLWFDYNNMIKNLIINNDLYFVNINNLITSQNLYIYLLSQIRLLYDIKNDEKDILNKLNKLNNVIDLKYVIYKINDDNNKSVDKINLLDNLLGEDKNKMFLKNKIDVIS